MRIRRVHPSPTVEINAVHGFSSEKEQLLLAKKRTHLWSFSFDFVCRSLLSIA